MSGVIKVTVAIPVNGQKKHNRRMWATVKVLFTLPESLRRDELLYWRERILFAILAAGVILGLFTLVPSIVVLTKIKLWHVVALNIMGYLCAVGLLVLPHIRYGIRASVTLLICYAIGLYVILSFGFLSGGPAWLFAFTVLAAVLLGLRGAYVALIVNGVTLTIVGWMNNVGHFGQNYPVFSSLERAIAVGASYMLLNTVVALSVAVLVRGLKSAAQREKSATDSLKRERTQLIDAKEKLKREVDERKQTEELLKDSEQKYRTLVEESFDGIFVQKGPKIIFANKVLQ